MSNEIFLGVAFLILFCAGYHFGATSAITTKLDSVFRQHVQNRLNFPFCIAEYEAGIFYLFDKTSRAFICQAETLDGLADVLSETKNINLALVTCPSAVEATSETFWFINGKARPVMNS